MDASDDPPQQVLERKFSESLPNEPLESTRAIIDREATGLLNLVTAYVLRGALAVAPNYYDYLPNTHEQAMWLSEHKGGFARFIGSCLLLLRVLVKWPKIYLKRWWLLLRR